MAAIENLQIPEEFKPLASEIEKEIPKGSPLDNAIQQVKAIAGKAKKEPGKAGAIVAGAAIAAGATAILTRKRKRPSRKGRKQPSRPRRMRAKPKRVARRAKKPSRKGRKLKFGSPAWRKKYLRKGSKRKKAGQRKKGKGGGSGSFYEIEQRGEFGKTAAIRGVKVERVGTEAQYKQRGGKAVKYTSKGQPYIILKSGRARFLKKSERSR